MPLTNASRKRAHTLVISLLKTKATDFASVLRSPATLNATDLSPQSGLEGTLYVAQQDQTPPDWLQFLQPAITGKVPDLNNMQAAAVLLLRHSRRIFALTFGQGRWKLKPDMVERKFGLKVVLNTVDPAQLRSIDSRTLEQVSLRSRKQTGVGVGLSTFALDEYKDLLQGVAGKPTDSKLAIRIAGADSLTITKEMDISELPDLLGALLRHYRDTRYQQLFPFVDNLSPVIDPDVAKTLDARLVAALKANAFGNMTMSVPIIVDWEDDVRFRYYFQGKRGADVTELDPHAFRAIIPRAQDISIENLRERFRVGVFEAQSGDKLAQFAAYKCLGFEVSIATNTYVLADGDWYQLATSYVNEINRSIRGIRPAAVTLPSYIANESEGDYNARSENANYLLLDKKTVAVRGYNSPIEVCDLFSRSGQFIHVKRKMRSATLSHLFLQGTNSGELFLRSPAFRTAFRGKVPRAQGTFRAMVTAGRPVAGRFEVVYAILTNSPRAITSLPFFSKLSLRNAANYLESLGYKVSAINIHP